MAVSHIFNNANADFTGTVTGFDSRGSTATFAATGMVRPSDWNSVHNQYYTLTGNTNNASVVSGSNVILSGGANVTLIGSSNVIGISVSNDVELTLDHYNPFAQAQWVGGQQGAGTLCMIPMLNAPNMKFDRVILPVQFSNVSNNSFSHTLSMSVGIYTKNNSTLSLLGSGSTSYAMTASGTVGSYSLWGGVRNLTIAMTTTLTAGNYWVGIWSRTTTGGGAGQTLNQILLSQMNSGYSGLLGAGTNTSDQYMLGQGRYSVSFASEMPSAVGFTDLQGNSSILQRPALFQFASGTI